MLIFSFFHFIYIWTAKSSTDVNQRKSCFFFFLHCIKSDLIAGQSYETQSSKHIQYTQLCFFFFFLFNLLTDRVQTSYDLWETYQSYYTEVNDPPPFLQKS